MDGLTFIVELANATAWPLAVFFIVLLLRKQVGTLIARLAKLKYKELEFEFREQVKQLEIEFREVATVPQSSPETVDAELAFEERIEELGAVSPRAAIMEAWRDLTLAAERALNRKSIHVPRTYRGLGKTLAGHNVLTQKQADLLSRLRKLRNTAVRADDTAISFDAAIEFAELAKQMITYFETAEAE